ncbi:putative Peroxyureidoacrylate/ureidoacrylate amidohydrolase RutB [Talaromyces proteolyticus]|uniref:Peroxyureidoacrylate/ureidoacrylate amidohydrolase RutB n=1 Tax=Talaromyces proteolyticus TaxID=1131652 RepID=A0AAD4PTM5_9EURO|nr:putative Peroxyureidoacrylate/ureidoacrylate amidohydrolase RutB [Talaromyces proteolyticus]KAH8688969.1 putative Peroxyureidoacrylate/ureidoacrylate amidohydrolase RutB [Talaromyces proteolyticus]
MHQSYIPTEALDRVAWMRGGHHKITVDPARTAHVVVDLQVGFMGEGALLEVPIARGIVENVNRVSRALRSAEGTIAYVQYKVDPDEPHHWGSHYDRMTPDAVERIRAAFTVGSEQHALWSGLDVQPEDLIVPKTRWSAFIPGTCDLDSLLKAKGIDTLIVTGTTTNCCCESTMRDAMQMGYHVLFVQDGNATRGDAVHNASLVNMLLFGDVVTADEVITRIEAGRHNEVA